LGQSVGFFRHVYTESLSRSRRWITLLVQLRQRTGSVQTGCLRPRFAIRYPHRKPTSRYAKYVTRDI
jgi:hypothetical protein